MKFEAKSRWTDSEIERLHRWFRYGGFEACCRHLKRRSASAIYERLRVEGLVGQGRTGPSKDAEAACQRWLDYCRAIGWSAADLRGLKNLWWRYRDDGGRFIEPTSLPGG